MESDRKFWDEKSIFIYLLKTSDLSAENRFKYEEGNSRSLAIAYGIETSNDH